ncbi:rh153 [macacine betaherpesvirus 3]|uniref:Rh153 n=1 Tax=Rhesus cytomegalovirus (strain 68-1) TaxID=47929 RepID=Q7TFI8_RHCM6|nr:rh153 [macacine betaherpesvirus 3]AAP50676.1 rh153 [macacine betaherpesvirus 3]
MQHLAAHRVPQHQPLLVLRKHLLATVQLIPVLKPPVATQQQPQQRQSQQQPPAMPPIILLLRIAPSLPPLIPPATPAQLQPAPQQTNLEYLISMLHVKVPTATTT